MINLKSIAICVLAAAPLVSIASTAHADDDDRYEHRGWHGDYDHGWHHGWHGDEGRGWHHGWRGGYYGGGYAQPYYNYAPAPVPYGGYYAPQPYYYPPARPGIGFYIR